MTATVNRTVQPLAQPTTVNRSVDPNARTDGLTKMSNHLREKLSLRTAHDTQYPDGLIYLVHWPAPGFFKVGFAVDDRHWRAYCGTRGGQLVATLTPQTESATVVEPRIHEELRAAGVVRAFTTKAAAAPYLGHRGAGWTECYVGDWRPVVDAFVSYSAREAS